MREARSLLVVYLNPDSNLIFSPQHASVTESEYEAYQVNSIIPGFGMLANCHLGLINIDNREPPQDKKPYSRSSPEAGAFTHLHNTPFEVIRDLPAGHELFDDYGNEWFTFREDEYGDIPLKHDFRDADKILELWEEEVDVNTETGADLYDIITSLAAMKGPRILNALPKQVEDAIRVVKRRTGTAIETVPQAIRSIEWLEENGFCIDNIRPKQSTVCEGKGAFASRNLPKGTIVAPAPMIHLHRDHLAMKTTDENGFDVWSGQQLLFNYVFGHPDTSILLFPYSPAVNYINHGHGEKANVAVRWSSRMTTPEFLNFTVDELVEENGRQGLMLEYYALRDIEKGEEILLDYGDDWEYSWTLHQKKWFPPEGGDEIETAWEFDTLDVKPLNSDEDGPPDYIQTRCLLSLTEMGSPDEDDWREWAEPDRTLLEHSYPCKLVSAETTLENDTVYYALLEADRQTTFKVRNIPSAFVRYADNEYLNNQFLRTSFRHFITLPDSMIPTSWKDLGTSSTDDEECGLYMAESAIPNSGLGVYTAKEIPEDARLFFGDVVIPVEDIEGNTRIRGWVEGIDGDLNDSEPTWMLNEYYWNSFMTNNEFEAEFIESMCPGLGMLANSHPSLFNVNFMPPSRFFDFGRESPSVGASSNYHDHHFVSYRSIQPGEEVFVEYGGRFSTSLAIFSSIVLTNIGQSIGLKRENHR